jgi:DNA sulfur modification protein DndE
MNLNKIKIDEDVTKKIWLLKSRTGLTPNILCRIGFCLSLNEPGMPDTSLYGDEGMEFNRYTLTGQWDSFFITLLKERCIGDSLNIENCLPEQFLAHLNRGIALVYNRVKNIGDLSKLTPGE